MAVPSAVGVRLQETRRLVGVTARELDRLARTSEGHVSLIESGVVQKITLETAGKLAGVLGITLDWFLSGKGTTPSPSSVQMSVDAARRARAEESGEYPAVDAANGKVG